MEVVEGVNLAVRFLLELGGLAAIGYWGFHRGQGRLTKIGLAAGLPLLAAAVWATFVAPGAAVRVPAALHLGLQVAFFGLAGTALAARRPVLARTLVLVALVNGGLMYAWGQ